MELASAVVGWNGSSWQFAGLDGAAPGKEQEYVFAGNVEGTEAALYNENLESEHVPIESYCSFEIVDIKSGFLQIIQ